MRMDELARPAIDAVLDGRVRITPDSQRKRYLDWMQQIRPWCISRQLWWGHRLPVYYCDACEETIVAIEPPARCGACGGAVRQDEDVLDTWFSSALWPFATLGWPEQTPELAAFYPTDVLSTARDIIFLWVARMIMMGLEFTGDVPFSDVYVHSVIQAPDGRRMSKSLGTGIDPLDEIDRHGADAVRFGLLAMSSSQDVRYSPEKVKQGQALANKLFNAARFVLTRSAAGAAPPNGGPEPATLEDRWILSRLARIQADTAARLERFDFSHAALGLYDFVYGELCDWYLELIKHRLRDDAPAADRAALAVTLGHVLRATVALAHPVIPFVTEELWPQLGGDGLLAGARVPVSDPARIDPEAEAAIGRAIEAITALRGWKDSAELPAGTVVPVRLRAAEYAPVAELIGRLARVQIDNASEAEPIAAVPIPGAAVDILPVVGVDLQAAERKMVKRRAELEAEIRRAEGKLANENFVAKAKPDVVEAEREKLGRLQTELEGL